MTREEFKIILDNKKYSHRNEGEKIMVGNTNSFMDLESLETLPLNVVFCNSGYVQLSSLIELPQGTIFENGGDIQLCRTPKFNKGVRFKMRGNRKIYAGYLEKDSLDNILGIKGINIQRVLNCLIEQLYG
jgi:hypothetical protein